jgi:competence protein ComEA
MGNGRWAVLPAALAMLAVNAWAQLPEGPGKEQTQRICKQCHELERSLAPRQNREGWKGIVDKMVTLGARGSGEDFDLILDYLAKNFPAEELPKINVNKATGIELESGLTLRRSQSAAVIEYRTKHGPFKSIEDLKTVPGIDAAKIEAKKERLTF